MTPSTSCAISVAELGAEVVQRRVGVLHDVVQERGGDRLLVEVELGADLRDTPRVVDELLAGAARHAAVPLLRVVEGAPDQLLVDAGVVRLDSRDQLADEVLVVAFGVDYGHESQCTSRVFPTRIGAKDAEAESEMRLAFQRTILLWRLRRMITMLDRSARTGARPAVAPFDRPATQGTAVVGGLARACALCTVPAITGGAVMPPTKARSAFTTRIDIGDDVRSDLVELLNARLADAFDLYGRRSRRTGSCGAPTSSSCTSSTTSVAEAVLPLVDEIAERVGQLGGRRSRHGSHGRRVDSLDEYPHDAIDGSETLEVVADRLAAVCRGDAPRRSTARRSSGDIATSDLFTEATRTLDKQLWFVEAHLQA